jgi:hypothetical protein
MKRCLVTFISVVAFTGNVSGQFYGRTEQGYFYNGNLARADIANEKREIRLQNGEFKEYAEEMVSQLTSEAYMEEYNTWKERGSAFLEDGETPIPENENFGKSHVNPRTPLGFGNPLYQQVHFNILLEDSISPFADAALNDEVPLETVDSGWILIRSIGEVYDSDMRPNDFQTLYNASPNKIIRVVCESCIPSHKEVFYKRLTAAPNDLLDIIENNWRTSDNTFNVDFQLFSSYDDAIDGSNPWSHCSGFNVPDQGFPGTCGPDGAVVDQWINMAKRNAQPDVAILVEDANASDDAYVIPAWEMAFENELTVDPEKAKQLGLCWHLPFRDTRRACWRACDYGENGDNLGASKLCRNLRLKGQLWKSQRNAEDSEVEEGVEEEKKIKYSHALGLDQGLPNLGTY